MYKHGQVDENQAEIVSVFRGLGASVAITSDLGAGFPDLVIGVEGETELVEVKRRKGRLTHDQEEWFDAWRGRKPVVVRSMGDAVDLVRDMKLRARRAFVARVRPCPEQ